MEVLTYTSKYMRQSVGWVSEEPKIVSDGSRADRQQMTDVLKVIVLLIML